MIKSSLAHKLRRLRTKEHLRQEDVARYLNIERQTYCNYENDTRTPPLETIILLADFFHVTVDYLVKEDNGKSLPGSQPLLTDTEKGVLYTFRSLPSKDQKEIIQFIQFKSSILLSEKKTGKK